MDLHLVKIKDENFCTICYNYKYHNHNNCPYRCTICNGFHKTHEHRCLICNIKNPNHKLLNCPFFYYYRHM